MDSAVKVPKPVMPVSKELPKFSISPSHISVLKSRNAQIKISFSGEPVPEITWRKGGKVIQTGRLKTHVAASYGMSS